LGKKIALQIVFERLFCNAIDYLGPRGLELLELLELPELLILPELLEEDLARSLMLPPELFERLKELFGRVLGLL